MRLHLKYGLAKIVTIATACVMTVALGATAIAVFSSLQKQMVSQADERHQMSLRTAASVISHEFEGVELTFDANGEIERLVMADIPDTFTDHSLIDEIGVVTGETVTIFKWEEETKDFWRKSTNIVKPDGSRAVGTELGQNGAVYPAILRGETYEGEATILGTPYYTVYLPIYSPAGDISGILYTGIEKSEIDGLFGEVAWPLLLVSVLVLIGAVLVMALLSRALLKPIPQLTEVASEIADGDHDADVPYREATNEIGRLARAIEVFQKNDIKKREAESDALEARQASETDRARRDEEREEAASELTGATVALGEALHKLADGDLTVRVSAKLPANLKSLGNDFDMAVSQLEETIENVLRGVTQLKTGTNEIAGASKDLSSRTESQATTLQQTAAAVTEITETVNRTAEGAVQAADTMTKAGAEAEKGGQVVSRAVAAMGDIEKSSKEISEIIGVIDELAFQTNLLALNAGVEAARAGEAGRGFAVVASEVRVLAQRCTDAAKQIKDLISTSTVQVDEGVKLVNQTGEALERIVNGVNEINQVVSSISHSAQEQAAGLKQVNSAVNELDNVTQHNAAMAEESTAATDQLMQQANELSQEITRFRTSRSQPARQAATAVRAEPSLRDQLKKATPHAFAQRKQEAPVAPVTLKLAATGTDDVADEWDEF
ncbi:methyl-accepting chemotaxis protein [Notoacmeibacter sp. MSK16QG-6]|uniref:methyl-accepting chemotaxis protein n=1 Tax=Notoacmeibacter sp. MSK16QG-6 TaxID=2957982 RepID=UPI0020A06053|nr:methyl-accepting chemotaxis protein [Notoacmeibacter sp. MSK16QG-6]MCP1199009.1 methyl-accepting chemotaxis protein [Notoacmeibacter sp. MSK16QG-6]